MVYNVHECPNTDNHFELHPKKLDQQHHARDGGWYIKVNWCCSARCCSLVHWQLSQREHLILARDEGLRSAMKSINRKSKTSAYTLKTTYAKRALPHYIGCVEAFVQGRHKTNSMRTDMDEEEITWDDAPLPKLNVRCLRPCHREEAEDKQVVANIARYRDLGAKAEEFAGADTDSYTQYAKIKNFGSIHPAALSEDWVPSTRPAVVTMIPMPVSDSSDILQSETSANCI